MGFRNCTLSRCRSWARLRPKELTSKDDGPFSGACHRDSAGSLTATAPVEPVPPITWLVSSMDLPQV
jgi:hypothetical protein